VTRRSGWLVVVVAVIALTAVWRVLPSGSPPIYDGNCIADPYESLGASPAPTSASKVFPAASAFPTSEVFTGENPPQAQLLMQTGTFDNSTTVTISITPVPPPAVKPPNGIIQGNVYKYSALTPSGIELEPKSGITAYIILRALTSIPAPVIDQFNGTTWKPLATFNSGCGNTFEATPTQLGEFATVGPAAGHGPSPASGSGGGGIPGVAIIVGLLVVLIAAVVVLFSLDRGRRRAR
jgi:hypothetical protein